MEIKGVLKKVHATVERGTFSSRKVWLTLDPQGQYPQTVEVEVSQAKINLFNNIPFGTWVTCSINLKGREWTNPEGGVIVFNTLSVWKVEVAGKEVGPVVEQQETALTPTRVIPKATRKKTPVAEPADDINSGDDQLPF